MRTRFNFLQDFQPSQIILIEGKSAIIPNILYDICLESIIYLNRDAIFIDGWNTFNPYKILKMAKSFGADRNILSRIHVARAFTDYQVQTLIYDVENVIKKQNPAVLTISYLSTLFQSSKRLLKQSINHLKEVTKNSNIITVVTSFEENELLNSNVDKIVHIKQTKDGIKVIEGEQIFEYAPVKSGQTRFTDFIEGNKMGRTIPTYRTQLEEIIDELSTFKRALRGEDKAAFEDIMNKARMHASSGTIVPTIDPSISMLISILIEQEKEINLLKKKLRDNE